MATPPPPDGVNAGEAARPAPPAQRRWRLVLATLGVLAAASLLGLTLAEGLVRVVAPQQLIEVRPDIWAPFDSVGWINRSNVRTSINTGERTVSVFTDEQGYRVDSGGPPVAQRTVLLVGDSFTQALQVEYRDSFGALLERELSDSLGNTVRVLNAGVDGWEPPQYAWRVRRVLAEQTPDAVVVALYLGNDLVTSPISQRPPRDPVRVAPFAFPRSLRPSAITTALLYPLNDRLERCSHLFVLLKRASDILLMRVGLTAVAFPTEILRSSAASPQWEVTADIAERISKESAQRGIPVIFALISSSYQADRQEFERFARGFDIDTAQVALDQPNQLLGNALRARQLTVIDPLPAFRERIDRGEVLFGRADRHFSPMGHRAFAEALRGELLRALSARRAR